MMLVFLTDICTTNSKNIESEQVKPGNDNKQTFSDTFQVIFGLTVVCPIADTNSKLAN